MEIQTFAEQLERWRRGERNEALEVKIKAIKRTGRTHARLWKHITAVVWREVKPWIESMVDEAKDGGIPMEGDAPDISAALMRGIKDAVEVGYRQGKQTVREIQKKVSLADDWHDVLPAEALDWIQGYVPELARVYEADVIEKVRDTVAASIREGKTLKHSVRELRYIKGQVEKFSRHRLEAIARTESMRAYNMGHLRGMIDSQGVAGVEFSAILDSRTSEPCEAREGLRFPLGSPELAYNSPPLHPNCRSILIPVMDVEVSDGWTGDPDFERKIQELPSTVQRECDIEVARKVLVGTTQVRVPEKIAFVPAETIQEANEFAESLGIAKHVDYQGIDVEVANAFNERLVWYRDNVKPELLNFDYFGTDTGRVPFRLKRFEEFKKNALKDKDIWPSDWTIKQKRKHLETMRQQILHGQELGDRAMAGFSPMENAIIFQEKYFYSKQRILDVAKADKGWNIVGDPGCLTATMDHELGHALDHNSKPQLAGDHKIISEWKAFAKKSADEATDSLSEYALANSREFVAESWSEFSSSASPRTIARTVGERIFELIRRSAE